MDESDEVKVEECKEAPKSVIIFDWDDTLLASSFLAGKGCRLDSDMQRCSDLLPHLRELEASVTAVLELALSYGHVFIVTNAETGWVQLSAQKFIPGVLPILEKVNILSARSTYEPMHPESPLKWKYYAFQERIASVCPDHTMHKNVLSFGDSHVEREAVRAVTRGLPNSKTKSVKFAERPSMEQLRRQIELVTNCFQYIHSHDGDLDLQLTVTVNPPGSPVPATQQGTTPTPNVDGGENNVPVPAPSEPYTTPETPAHSHPLSSFVSPAVAQAVA